MICSIRCRAANEVGFNAGETLEKAVLSRLLGDTHSGWFLPFHLTYSRDLNDEFQLTADFIYRYDNLGSFNGYEEHLFLAGVGYRLYSDVIGTLKFGGGKARGQLLKPTKGFDGNLVEGVYSCSELAAQANLQKRNEISESFEMGLGGGLLLIMPTSCQNRIALTSLGVLVHQIVPVFNWDLIYKF